MRVSVITAVFNREDTIRDAVLSVQTQDYPSIEHLIVDGLSIDGTVDYLKTLSTERVRWISEKDYGIYDAINKGIHNSTGQIIGLLHSDDLFSKPDNISKVVALFGNGADIVYGDLEYVSKNNLQKIIRKWKSGSFVFAKLRLGWMPPHPTVFLKRSVFQKHGFYDTSYGIAADYDFLLRALGDKTLKVAYLPEVLVRMRTGGVSNRSFRNIVQKSLEDYRAIKANNIGGLMTLVFKNVRKIPQFF
jgi:glycosyltransferase